MREDKPSAGFLHCFEEMQLKEVDGEQGEAGGHHEANEVSEGLTAFCGGQNGNTMCLLGTLYGLREGPCKQAIATAA